MKALAVANEALDSLFNNFLIAVRISIPVIVLIGVVIALSVYELINAYMFNAPLLPAISAVNSRIAVVWILDISVFLFGIYWIATAWHRFILLGERPGRFFPKLHLGPTWSYIWRILLTGFLLGFSLGILALIIAAVLGVESFKITIGEYGDAIARGPLHIAMTFGFTFLFIYFFLRYAGFLPAAAAGRTIEAKLAWRATAEFKSDFLVFALGYSAMTLVYSYFGTFFSFGHWLPDLLQQLFVQWVAFMFSISLLTTILIRYVYPMVPWLERQIKEGAD